MVINAPIVRGVAEQNNVSPSLILAMIKVESNYKADAVSHKGAIGMMQLMPDTSAWISEKTGIANNPYDAFSNIQMGAWYMGQYLLPKYNGNVERALAAYNAGEGNVAGWADGEIRFAETQNYVKRVKWWKQVYDFFL
ncbi:MAG: lytic transglycosylase domain-containing protein [Oscillospiraceae bacterium]|nr:lytic transglycosylase domain-containing protein [Oscillospiraceae bacterium]